MPKKCYPFPARNPAQQVLPCAVPSTPGLQYYDLPGIVDRVHGADDARRARLQYLTIEEELERAYRYVTPCGANADAFSFKFAEIIRSAANAYEVQCKRLYATVYNPGDSLNICNYLALERFLRIASLRVVNLLAADAFGSCPEVHQPFGRLAGWKLDSVIEPEQSPCWWGAYNAIKHEGSGSDAAATLAHATAAVAALFLVTEALYGGGILSGGFPEFSFLHWGSDGTNEVLVLSGAKQLNTVAKSTVTISLPRWSRLFQHEREPPPFYLVKAAPGG